MPGSMATAARPALVLTVDDAEPFRRAAHAVAEATEGFAAAAEVASGEEAVACAQRLRPDLVLVDVHLPGIDGVETSRRIAELLPDALIVLVSGDAPPWPAGWPPACGAVGFLPKERLSPRALRAMWDARGVAV
jgi:two-component system, NarL family, invasion response regulator UvrY